MSNYSHALAQVVNEHFEGKQTRMASTTGISQALLSRHMSGKLRPDLDTLEKICRTLTPSARAKLAAAHLNDELVPSARYDIEIRLAKEPEALKDAAASAAFNKLDHSTQEALEIITQECLNNPAARDAMQSTAKWLKT